MNKIQFYVEVKKSTHAVENEGPIPEPGPLASFIPADVGTELDALRRVFSVGVGVYDAAVPNVACEPGEDVPGEAGHEEGVEAKVEVEESPNPLPL